MINGKASSSESAAPKRCIALAYQWYLTPVDFQDYHIVLTVRCYDSARPDSMKRDATRNPWTRTFHARLPDKRLQSLQTDVSGNLGIIFPVSDDGAGKRASASERLIADAIIWELGRITFDSNETIVLLQGPLLPKLRGRLLYRGVPENLSIWSLTWQPEWFRRLEASEQLLKNIEQAGCPSQVYPPKGIDRASRSWVFRPAEKIVYHF